MRTISRSVSLSLSLSLSLSPSPVLNAFWPLSSCCAACKAATSLHGPRPRRRSTPRHGVFEANTGKVSIRRISDPLRRMSNKHAVCPQVKSSRPKLSYILNAAGKFMQNATMRACENVCLSTNSLPSVRMKKEGRRANFT